MSAYLPKQCSLTCDTGGLGVERLEDLLPDIISNTSSLRAYVREGYISLLVFLPSVFGDRFSPYLGRIIQPILSGLADDSDYVRDASMRAGRMIVTNHSTKAIDLLLPELETGLFDASWRIRQRFATALSSLLDPLKSFTVRSNWSENSSSALWESLPKQTLVMKRRKKTKKIARHPKIPRSNFWKSWARNAETEYSLQYTLFGKIHLVLCVSCQCTYGKRWSTIPLARFERCCLHSVRTNRVFFSQS